MYLIFLALSNSIVGGVRKVTCKNICFQATISKKWIRQMLHIQTVVYVSFQPILVSVTSFVDMPNPLRILYNMYLQTDSRNLCGCMLHRCVLAMIVVVKLTL
jgi:hypothetical protein